MRKTLACTAAIMIALGAPLTTQAAEPSEFVHDPVYSQTVYIWNYWNRSKEVGAPADAPTGVKFDGVAWNHDFTTYNNEYPGTHQVQLCSINRTAGTGERCYNVTAHRDAWTDVFNDQDVATTKFFFKHRWYSSKYPDSGSTYPPLVGSGIKPHVQGSVGAWWGASPAPSSTSKSPTASQSLKKANSSFVNLR